MAGDYPPRPKCYAAQFLRALFEGGAAAAMGPNVVALLACVVAKEDAAFYAGPVCLSPDALAAEAGLTRKVFLMARKVAVELGWLAHEPGDRGSRPKFWTLIPTADSAHLRSRNGTLTGTLSGDLESQKGTATGTTNSHLKSRNGTLTGTLSGTANLAVGGDIGGAASQPSGFEVPLSPDPDRRPGETVGRSEAEPFDPIRHEQDQRREFIRRWNAAGLSPVVRLPLSLQSFLSQRLADPVWAEHYPAAIEQAGRIAFLRDGTGRRNGRLDVSEFLRDDDFARRILAGKYNPAEAPPKAREPPGSRASADAERMRRILDAKKGGD